MDLSTVGIIPNLAKSFSKKQSLEMFRRMCNTRYFELKVLEAYNADLINLISVPLY